jgi:hypothetical protein
MFGGSGTPNFEVRCSLKEKKRKGKLLAAMHPIKDIYLFILMYILSFKPFGIYFWAVSVIENTCPGFAFMTGSV